MTDLNRGQGDGRGAERWVRRLWGTELGTVLGSGHLSSPQAALRYEWLVTNGAGGFAASTPVGANARRYHGLLIAALDPPVRRHLLLSKVEEELAVGGGSWHLGTNFWRGGVHPHGYRHLWSFHSDPVPTFTFALGGVLLTKRVWMPRGRQAVYVRYDLLEAPETVRLRLYPLVNARDYHHTVRENPWPFTQTTWSAGTEVEAYPGAPRLRLAVDRGEYHVGGFWWREMFYPSEEERGLDCIEDHFNPGWFEVALLPGEGATLLAALCAPPEDPLEPSDGLAHLEAVIAHRQALLQRAGPGPAGAVPASWWRAWPRLVWAADQFVVSRRTGGVSILAGYPWFTDWGRDAMIALPGLALATGRPELCREVLATFAAYCRDGLLPNRFPDLGEEPEYNTVDASLWWFEALWRYLGQTGDWEFALDACWPAVHQILRAYARGTHYGIGARADGLLWAGVRGVQLTWMDAKVGDWVVTPRHGCPVEVNALWYNALRVGARLAQRRGEGALAEEWANWAERVREAFLQQFWNAEQGCLYDVLGEEPDPAVRPNQLLALSLSFPVLDPEMAPAQARSVVAVCRRHLLTPYGLRSLAPQDPAYRGRYQGNVWERDSAYHQGSVWAWLLGPFVEAARRVGSETAKQALPLLLEPLLAHLDDAGLGSISEIFDGDWPHRPRGCFAQAWSVAELLRMLAEPQQGEARDAAGLGDREWTPAHQLRRPFDHA